MSTEQVLITSDEAAKFVTGIEGWIDRYGRFWGKNEAAARWSGCTHIVCPKCETPTPKNYTLCSNCRERSAIDRYNAKKEKLWNGDTPLYSDASGEYFFQADDLIDYIEEHECTVQSLRLVICDPIKLRHVDKDYFCDDLAEDDALSSDVLEALDVLNEVIRAQPPVSWYPGKYAARFDLSAYQNG